MADIQAGKMIVIGMSGMTNDIGHWTFTDPGQCRTFCEMLATHSGRSVYVISGAVTSVYDPDELKRKKKNTIKP